MYDYDSAEEDARTEKWLSKLERRSDRANNSNLRRSTVGHPSHRIQSKQKSQTDGHHVPQEKVRLLGQLLLQVRVQRGASILRQKLR